MNNNIDIERYIHGWEHARERILTPTQEDYPEYSEEQLKRKAKRHNTNRNRLRNRCKNVLRKNYIIPLGPPLVKEHIAVRPGDDNYLFAVAMFSSTFSQKGRYKFGKKYKPFLGDENYQKMLQIRTSILNGKREK